MFHYFCLVSVILTLLDSWEPGCVFHEPTGAETPVTVVRTDGRTNQKVNTDENSFDNASNTQISDLTITCTVKFL